MNLLFEKEVAELNQRGIGIAELTPDEIAELVHACDRMQNPYRDANLEAVGMPVVLSDGTTLFNLTIGATVWLDEYAGKWWSAKSKSYFWAMVYALANGRNRDAFTTLTDRDVAKSAIVKMALNTHVTEEELLQGIERAVHKRETGTGKHLQGTGQGSDWGEILRTLEATTGIPCEHWVWNRSADWCVQTYHRQNQFAEAMKGRSLPRMKDELDAATNNLAQVRFSILHRLGKDAQ